MNASTHDSLVLNVDDNDGARYAKTRILTRAGLRVIEAASGGEALLSAHEHHPDLVLLDMKLPDIHGMEVCRMLKQDGATSSILVLQTSASYLSSADKIRALDGGADNYLFEPIEPEELVANVKALLGRLTSHSTWPNVIIGGQSIGGSDDLAQLHAAGGLLPLLAQVGVKSR